MSGAGDTAVPPPRRAAEASPPDAAGARAIPLQSRSDGLRVVERRSPNCGPRRGGARPDMVVLHYTGMESAEAAADRLCEPAAEVSAHYLIARDGAVLALVPEDMRAWHAGVASWGGVADVNSRSIGIELENPGHFLGYPPFPEPQMAALEQLLAAITARWGIRPERVLGHACVAPGRKIDPGEKLDWRRLARRGLAVWLDAPLADGPADAVRFRRAARRFGYAVDDADGWTEALSAVWRSFAMRFRPPEAAGGPSGAGLRHLEALAARWPALESAASID